MIKTSRELIHSHAYAHPDFTICLDSLPLLSLKYSCTAHWMAHCGPPTAYGPSQPSIWGLGGKRLRGRPRGRSRKNVDHVNILGDPQNSLFPMFRGISMEYLWTSMGISIRKSVEFHPTSAVVLAQPALSEAEMQSCKGI